MDILVSTSTVGVDFDMTSSERQQKDNRYTLRPDAMAGMMIARQIDLP